MAIGKYKVTRESRIWDANSTRETVKVFRNRKDAEHYIAKLGWDTLGRAYRVEFVPKNSKKD